MNVCVFLCGQRERERGRERVKEKRSPVPRHLEQPKVESRIHWGRGRRGKGRATERERKERYSQNETEINELR